MRKAIAGISATIIVLFVCAMNAFAAGSGSGRYFEDADGDGVCDNYVAGQCGRGSNFADADGDGVCDNYVLGQGQRGGCGGGHGNGRRNGIPG